MSARRAIEVYREEGLRQLFRSIRAFSSKKLKSFMQGRVRPQFRVADEIVEYNGIRTRPYRIVDPYLPGELSANQGGHLEPADYEFGLCNSIRRNVNEGQTVVVVGGGLGVTAVLAAQQVGPSGEVVVYEGAENMITHIEETLELNDVPCRVEVNHAIVASAERLDGHRGDADVVPPGELPECDVLEMDCEGAETEILPSLRHTPETLIVETHNNLSQVRRQLRDLGYSIRSNQIAEVGAYREMCEEDEIRILTANGPR